MSDKHSITRHLSGVRRGDQRAIQDLFERIRAELEKTARKRLGASKRRAEDEEDLLQDALLAFCIGVQEGRFPNLHDRHDLMRVLTTIIKRKAHNQVRDERRQKRGGGKVKGESVFEDAESAGGGLQGFSGDRDGFARAVSEGLDLLDDPELMRIALYRLAGHSDDEIMEMLSVGASTLRRKLRLIEELWETWSRDAQRKEA